MAGIAIAGCQHYLTFPRQVLSDKSSGSSLEVCHSMRILVVGWFELTGNKDLALRATEE